MPSVVALIPAAGSGSRFGGETPKPFCRIQGKTVLAHAIDSLRAAGIERMAVAVDAQHYSQVQTELVQAGLVDTVVVGGATRQESVMAGLAAVPGEPVDLVLVHDAARPAVEPDDVRRTLEAAASADGAVLGRSLVDTIKRLEGDRIVETVDRRCLFRAETPQVFRRAALVAAYERARREGFVGTDEASLVERDPMMRIVRVEAMAPNPKLTYATDWPWVEQLITESSSHRRRALGEESP